MIPTRTSDLLKIVVGVGRVADNDDIVDIREIDAHHEDISGDDDTAAIWFPHEFPGSEVIVVPVQRVIHPQLLRPDTKRRIKLPPEVTEDPKPVPDACAEDNYLLSLHVFDDPLKVRELLTLNAMAENAEEELDFWPSVRPPHGMIVSESDELADLIGLISRE